MVLEATRTNAFACITFLLLITAISPAHANGGEWDFDGDWLPGDAEVLTVGLRIAWDLASGETVFGAEASYTFLDNVAHGPVFAIDLWRGGSRWQFGYEIVTESTIGVELGPTVAFRGDRDTLGWHVLFFGGAFVIPYYQLTMLIGPDAEEAGFMVKLPAYRLYTRSSMFE